MPVGLISPRSGETPYYAGARQTPRVPPLIEHQALATERSRPAKVIGEWGSGSLEAGQFAIPGEPTFSSAAIGYI